MSDERIPVVQYVRMSTDHQRYSIANQRAAMEAYAERHGMDIVGTFEDSGKSGLHLDSRIALQQLLGIVQSGNANFKAILVYDVSRWGRFQNPDEGAHYEYLCTMAGVKVIFCAEPFENDGSPLDSVVKSLKRSMAAEYSRELSIKVFAGHCRLARMGFRQGGPAGYGLKRVLLDEMGCYKADLACGERKNLQSDRVILAPGPPEEVEVVRRIYRDFIERHMTEKHIAEALNREGLTLAPGRPWRQGTIHKVLVSEKYTGRNVYGRTSFRLTTQRSHVAPALWLRCDAAFAPIIPADIFEKAQKEMRARVKRYTDEEMLDKLKSLYLKHGHLSTKLIRAQRNMPSCSSYKERFGNLTNAYALVGFDAGPLYDYVKIDKAIKERYEPLLGELERLVVARGGIASVDLARRRLMVNGAWTAQLEILPSRLSKWRRWHFEWRRRTKSPLDTDLLVLVRMNSQNSHFLDYFIIPSIYLAVIPKRMKERSGGLVDMFRFSSLEIFGSLVTPSTVGDREGIDRSE
jgi:DNA invertase Pin-like site-specific DNA recombinase